MKRVSQIVFSLALMGMLFLVHAEAATSQGLEWGLEVGGQYNYDYVIADSDNETLMEEVIHFSVNTRPSIPNIVNVWDELPTIEADITWANDSLLEESVLAYFMHAVDVEFVLPIGNWTFLTELYEDSAHFDGTISDTASYWDLDGTIMVYGEATIHVDYLKDDGLMAHFTLNYYNGSLSVTRQGLSGGFDYVPLLVGVGGFSAGVIVLYAIIRYRSGQAEG